MFEVIFVEQNQLTTELLNEIIAIKSVAWGYTYESQLDWINRNLKDSDIHVLLLLDKKPIAYLNLVQIELQLDTKTYEGLGIGNVCAIEKGKGWGTVLMSFVNNFIIEHNKIGLLFCKKELIRFYSENGWGLVSKEDTGTSQIHTFVYTFIINAPKEYKYIEYFGRPF